MTDAVAVTDKAKAIELVSRPTNPKATHIFMGLSGDTYLAGQCVEGVLLVVVNQPVVIQSIGLIVRGVEYVSWFQGVTQSERVEGVHWWMAKRLGLYPDDGSIDCRKVMRPGTYSYPFSFRLPNELPCSFENVEDRLVDFGISNELKAHTLDNTCIRYSVNGFCEIFKEDTNTVVRLAQTKTFRVVETFDTSSLLLQASVRKGQAEYFFGGPITCMFWVANHGHLLRGQHLHVAIEVDNKSSYDVDHVLISVWEHKVFIAPKEGDEPHCISLTRVIQELVIKDSLCKTGEKKRKVAKFQLKAPNPSVSHGKLIKVSYEVGAEFVQVVDNIVLKAPLTVYGYCDQLRPLLPASIPINIHNDRVAGTLVEILHRTNLKALQEKEQKEEQERKEKEEQSSIFGTTGFSLFNRLKEAWESTPNPIATDSTTTTTTSYSSKITVQSLGEEPANNNSCNNNDNTDNTGDTSSHVEEDVTRMGVGSGEAETNETTSYDNEDPKPAYQDTNENENDTGVNVDDGEGVVAGEGEGEGVVEGTMAGEGDTAEGPAAGEGYGEVEGEA